MWAFFLYFYSLLFINMNLTFKNLIIIFILGASSLTSCFNDSVKSKEQVAIAITKAHGSDGYEQYKNWILSLDSSILIYDLYDLHLDSALQIMNMVDGLIISGGPDVNPIRYGFGSMAYVCETPDDNRDLLELEAIDFAYKNQLPILGICRGQQILNVYFGGTLITDIPTQHPSNIFHRGDGQKSNHPIFFTKEVNSISIIQLDSAIVNSSHHQAIKDLGETLQVLAYSPDSIIESVGLIDTQYSSFFIGVQFHPEYMPNSELALSTGQEFLKSASKFSNKKK